MSYMEIREKFLKFFKSKGHKIVPSSSLLPSDPSVLFTTAGMQQFKQYYTDPASAPAKNVVSIQKCLRTSDIDEVGDDSHLTFFEMLGNFSFGGYGKKEAIEYTHGFITKELGLKIDYVTVFGGASLQSIFKFKKIEAENLPADVDSQTSWEKFNVKIEVKKDFEGLRDNFWGPTGIEGPCGPTTEIYVNGMEVWNIVFNEYYCSSDFKFTQLKMIGIDTGMGLERLAMVVQGKSNIFETDLFSPLMDFLPKELPEKIKRIITDHARSVVFLLSEGVRPSNKEASYVLRRFLRRVFVYTHFYKLRPDTLEKLMKIVFQKYGEMYQELFNNRDDAINTMWMEYEKFNKTVSHGIMELKRLEKIDAAASFTLYESYGLPYEIIKEIGGEKAKDLTRENFEIEFKRHQEISRAGTEKKFGGHGIADGDDFRKTRLHTATHVLAAALGKVLGEQLKQNGSDITAERLRFDFTFPRKITPEELKQAEDIANDVVSKDLPVTAKEMSLQEALDSGAGAFFKMKYPNRVTVYTIGPEHREGQPFSRELCGGPHVSHTAEIGHITITKEESVSGGNRRIRAIVD